MAEAVFADKVAKAGLEGQITTDSAGTGSWHTGQPPHRGTRQLLAEKGIDCSHRGRQITSSDLTRFDYIVTMDSDNTRDVRRLGRTTAKLVPLLSYYPASGLSDIPDPWITGDFDETYQLIDCATTGLLAEIRRSYQL